MKRISQVRDVLRTAACRIGSIDDSVLGDLDSASAGLVKVLLESFAESEVERMAGMWLCERGDAHCNYRNGCRSRVVQLSYQVVEILILQYAGYGIWNRRNFRSGVRWKDRSEWKIVENAHPAIITLEEAEAIHAIRESRSCRPGKRGSRPSPYILSGGLLVCSRCGANYAGRTKHGVDYYVCGSQIYRYGAGCGEPWYVRREDLENVAFECIQRVLSCDSVHTRRIVERYNEWVDSQHALYASAVEAREREVQRLSQEISNLTDSVAKGMDPDVVAEAVREEAADRAPAGVR